MTTRAAVHLGFGINLTALPTCPQEAHSLYHEVRFSPRWRGSRELLSYSRRVQNVSATSSRARVSHERQKWSEAHLRIRATGLDSGRGDRDPRGPPARPVDPQ